MLSAASIAGDGLFIIAVVPIQKPVSDASTPSVLSQQLGTGALGGKGGRRRALLLWMMEEFAARQAEPLLSTRLCTLW